MGLWSHSRHEHRIDFAEDAGRLLVPRPPQVLRQGRQLLMKRGDEVPDVSRLADDGRQLSARGRQHPHIVFAERPGIGRLDDQHALQHAAVDDRHAEECGVRVLPGLLEILETRMPRRVFDNDGADLLGHQAGQTLGDAHAHPAHTFLAQADRGGQHQRRPIGFEQIDRPDVGREPLLNQIDDVGQGFGGIAAAGDQMADLLQRPEERRVGLLGLHERPNWLARSLPRRFQSEYWHSVNVDGDNSNI